MTTEANNKVPEKTAEQEDLLFGGQIKPYEKAEGQKRCCTRKRTIIILVVLVMLLLYAIGLGIGLAVGLNRDKEEDKNNNNNNSSEVKLPRGAVVTDHEACSEVGRRMLERHGTVVDAAIAALICNGVRTPHSMGIGGGCYMVIYDKASRGGVAIDGRETAPRRMSHETYLNLTAEKVQARLIGVPGELKAYRLAHNLYGHLPWNSLFEPTIKMIREGFPLSPATARALKVAIARGTKLQDHPVFCEIFCANTTTGEPKEEGAMIYWPKLGDTLEGIANKGPEYIYESQLTTTLVEEINELGGIFETKDFILDYKPIKEPAMKFDLGEYDLYTMGGTSGGPVLGLIVNILKGLKFDSDGLSTTAKKVDTYHKIIEAIKFAYADRAKLGDPMFENTTELLMKMQSEDYATFLRSRVDEKETHDVNYYTTSTGEYVDTEGTSHVSVVSPYGDAISITSTINYYFGSTIISNATGIIWNNEMQDFDTKPETSPNLVKPGKRPRSSMSPAIIVNKSTGKVKLVTGAAGGSRITTTTAQIIARVLLLNQSLEDATNEKRFHHMLYGNKLYLEKGFPEDILEGLKNTKKHDIVRHSADYMAVAESILMDDNGVMKGYADRRKPPGKTSYMYEFNRD